MAVQNNVELEIKAITDSETWKQEFEKIGMPAFIISAGKWRRYASFQNFLDIFKTVLGMIQSTFYLFFYMPDLIFSKGGFVSIPPSIIARIFFIPIFIHDSDVVPGAANRFISKFAKKIFVSFEKSKEFFPDKDVVLTGNPIREGIAQGNKEKALEYFKLKGQKPVILIIGGSQGAEIINNAVLEGLTFLSEKYEIIHQTGSNNYQKVSDLVNKTIKEGKATYGVNIENNYRTYPFLDFERLRDAYEISSVIILRGSAGGIFEIAAVGKPAIIIPISKSANNHQGLNAEEFLKFGAIVIREENLTPHILSSQIDFLLEPATYSERSKNISSFKKSNAAQDIANEILNYVYK